MVAAVVLFSSSPALAQDAAGSEATKATKQGDGWRYVFDDEPLTAGGLDAKDARVRVVPHAFRTTLLRPRTSFVTEMLASVEEL